MGDITQQTYPCLMYCLCQFLEQEFKTYFERTKIHGWATLHDKVTRVEIALWDAEIGKEYPNKALFLNEMDFCMSLAKDLLGHHGQINFLWRLQNMIKNWEKQNTIKFSELTKIE